MEHIHYHAAPKCPGTPAHMSGGACKKDGFTAANEFDCYWDGSIYVCKHFF